MYRFVYFQDLHADNHLFLARKDDFEQSCLNKLKDLVEASNRLGCPLVCGGDLINGPYLGHSFINRMIDILRDLHSPLLLVLGNHDIIGRNLLSYNSSTLGLMVKARVLSILSDPQKVEDVVLVPVPYNEDQIASDYGLSLRQQFPDDNDIDTRPRLIITHNMVLPDSAIFSHMLASDVAKFLPSKSALLIGHYHVPFMRSENDIQFINIGSSGRVSRSPGERRVPEYAIITVTGSELDIDRRRFPSAKAWDEVFEPKAVSTGDNMIDAKDFFNSYEDKSLDVNDIMRALAEKMNIDPKVVEESRARLDKVRHRMSKENNRYG